MLTNIYDVLRAPSRAFERIAAEEDIYKALNVQGLIFFINGLVNETNEEDPLWLVVVSAVLSVPIVLGICFLAAGITHLFARFWGGQGTWKKQFIVLGYSMLPQLIFIPIQVIALFLELYDAVIAAAVGASVWSFVLSVIATAKAQNITNLRAFAVLIAPTVIAVAVVIAVYASVIGMS